MPVNPCSENGNPGFKWGDSGKCYIYTRGDVESMGEAKRKATIQGLATGEYENTKSFDEEKLDISIQLDYADYIKEYINKQKYDNDTFREGVVTEYDEVIKIYNENYSSKKD